MKLSDVKCNKVGMFKGRKFRANDSLLEFKKTITIHKGKPIRWFVIFRSQTTNKMIVDDVYNCPLVEVDSDGLLDEWNDELLWDCSLLSGKCGLEMLFNNSKGFTKQELLVNMSPLPCGVKELDDSYLFVTIIIVTDRIAKKVKINNYHWRAITDKYSKQFESDTMRKTKKVSKDA